MLPKHLGVGGGLGTGAGEVRNPESTQDPLPSFYQNKVVGRLGNVIKLLPTRVTWLCWPHRDQPSGELSKAGVLDQAKFRGVGDKEMPPEGVTERTGVNFLKEAEGGRQEGSWGPNLCPASPWCGRHSYQWSLREAAFRPPLLLLVKQQDTWA